MRLYVLSHCFVHRHVCGLFISCMSSWHVVGLWFCLYRSERIYSQEAWQTRPSTWFSCSHKFSSLVFFWRTGLNFVGYCFYGVWHECRRERGCQTLKCHRTIRFPESQMSMIKAYCRIICNLFWRPRSVTPPRLGIMQGSLEMTPNPRNAHYYVDPLLGSLETLKRLAQLLRHGISDPKQSTPKLPFSPIPLDLDATQSRYTGPYTLSHPYRQLSPFQPLIDQP